MVEIDLLIANVSTKAHLFFGVLLAVLLIVLSSIMVDLWDGLHTARATGEKIHSHKMRVTMAKVFEYWRFVLMGFLIDCIGMIFDFYSLPWVVMLFGIGIVCVECKSMFEHAGRRRSHLTELPDIVKSIVKCAHERDAQVLIKQILENHESKQGDKREDEAMGGV